MITSRGVTALALLTSAVGIVAQILGGHDYPAIPPGIVLLVVAAAIVWFVPGRAAPVAGILVALFLIVGLFAAGQASRLIEVHTALDTLGLWIQMAAVVVALVAAVVALLRPRPSSHGIRHA